jgi:hypothetical protein
MGRVSETDRDVPYLSLQFRAVSDGLSSIATLQHSCPHLSQLLCHAKDVGVLDLFVFLGHWKPADNLVVEPLCWRHWVALAA